MPAATALDGEGSRDPPAPPAASAPSRLRALLLGRVAALSGVRCGAAANCLAAVSRSAGWGASATASAAAGAGAAPTPLLCSTCSTRAGRYSFSP